MNLEYKLSGNEKVQNYKTKVHENPKVSICVQTYNHENYIRKCLDGILMQQVDFDFEILLGEDHSKDNTRKICIEYAEKYSSKIRLFLHDRSNVIYVNGNPSGRYNFLYNLNKAEGKYIAICEGDDYWIDPLKLQKQVHFLDKNQDYGMVYSDTYLINKNGERINANDSYGEMETIYGSGFIYWDLLQKNFINTLTICVRKELFLDYFNNFQNEEFSYDLRYWLFIALRTKIKFFDEKMANYRVHSQGISRNRIFFKKRKPLVMQSALLDFLSMNKEMSSVEKTILFEQVLKLLLNKNISIKEKGAMLKFLSLNPKYLFLLINTFLIKIYKRKYNIG